MESGRKKYNNQPRKDNRVHRNVAVSKSVVQRKKLDDIGGFGSTPSDDISPFKNKVHKCIEEDSSNESCIICLIKIKNTQPIWQCPTCFSHLFHLFCIQQLITKGVKETTNGVPNTKYWSCPNCKSNFEISKRPSEYRCYCGKVVDPTPDPWLKPHTCGQICDRPLIPDCGHLCTQECHPGKCKPCGSMLMVDCNCGSKQQMRACSSRSWSCSTVCNKVLVCGIHKCPIQCHSGGCPPCNLTSLRSCRCGRELIERPCIEGIFSCGKVCNRPYSCGHHSCLKECHTGECGLCPGKLPRFCYCGKKQIKRPCWEDVAESCMGDCDKLLECGIHRCLDKCHIGPCPKCREFVIKKCPCGRKSKRVQCHAEYRCDIKCQNILNCTKHKCGQRCCIGNCDTCNRICDTPLNCGNHRCQSICHVGLCHKCPLTMEVTCPCKVVRQIVECGKRYVLPHQIERTCLGLHKRRLVDCNISGLECSELCGNPLACGNHFCTLTCHTISVRRQVVVIPGSKFPESPVKKVTLLSGEDYEDTCTPCTLPCERKERLCKHKCNLPCHPNNCPECEVIIRIDCYCNRVRKYLLCWQTFDKELFAQLRSCGIKCDRKLESCNHLCDLNCHPGKCPSDQCIKKVSVKCQCKRIKQFWTCDKVRAELLNLNLRTIRYNILPCDEECKQLKQNEKEIVNSVNSEDRDLTVVDTEEPVKRKRKTQNKREQSVENNNLKVEKAIAQRLKKKKEWYNSPGFMVTVVGLIFVGIGFLVWRGIL